MSEASDFAERVESERQSWHEYQRNRRETEVECPECGHLDTQKEAVDFELDRVEAIYTCGACKTVFAVSLADPIKEVIDHE